MPIYVILAGCLQAPRRRARVTKRAQFCSSMARLAHTGTQGTGWSLRQALLAVAELPRATQLAQRVPSQRSPHHVPGCGTDMPFVSLSGKIWGRLLFWVGVGVSVWYSADMQLYSVLRAGRTSASSKPRASWWGWIVHGANHSYTAPDSSLAWIHPDSETERVLTYRLNTTQSNPDIHGI